MHWAQRRAYIKTECGRHDEYRPATMNAIALAAALTAFLGCIALGVRTDKSRRV